MKEITSAFQSEIFTPVVTLVAPGVIALSPITIAVLIRHKEAWPILDKHSIEGWLLLTFASVIIGLILENFGSLIETRIFDNRLPKKDEFKNHESEWYSYLRLAFKIEPVGHRHLRMLVLHLRFERNACIAFVAALMGCLHLPFSWLTRGILGGACLVLVIHLFFEAKRSHQALSELRRELLKGIVVAGDVSSSETRAATAK